LKKKNELYNGTRYISKQFTNSKNNNEIFKRYSNSENELRQLAKTNAHRSTVETYNQCDNISTWMMNEGKVSWQFEYISRGQHGNLKYLQNVQTFFFFFLYIF